ncbi:uncharacterized protein B0H18DRAFT_887542 [Fomitopsis serialis]|uniref:uncharacterized protein n=1 Tax=Fomitopsis serialis TaxID=139415 RepID=UPI002008BC56|nr:uncharacterized protein B0H18DRAFT_887542 [Neoantrodia serialis]KAH9914021.1 hypothetical protein B0H18DRAFT_887542 [Neoantrodia serialis]
MLFLGLASFLFLLRFALLHVHGAQTFWPLAIPFAVRTPYLNSWMYTTKTLENITNDWPTFWNGATHGWLCYIRVDGRTYTLFGDNDLPSNYSVTAGTLVQTEVTPTRTIQVIQAGPMAITLTFLTLAPVMPPSDLVRQSLPFAYVAVNFTSTNGQPHDIQLYSDMDGGWLYGGNAAQQIQWSVPTQTGNIIYLESQLVNPTPFQEHEGQGLDGAAYIAMELVRRNVTSQTCQDIVCREEFLNIGHLNANDNNQTFRGIDVDWPIFPMSVDLGSVASLESPVVWAVGYVRDPSISYPLLGNTASLRPYYTTQYPTTEEALEFFISDFDNSLTQANLLDTQVREAASSISADGKLYDMLSLATRQVFSSLEITAPYQSDATTRIFMKDLGTSQRVTPVEKLYAALPLFLYYNASLVKPLLVPLLEQQNTSLGEYPYASKDLGSLFPAVSGPNLTSTEAIELVIAESGNMLIIALAHANYSNDTSLLHGYYPLLKNWAEYLTGHGPFPPQGQLSVDDGSDATNSTNLAVKGIFAIQAMAEISQLVGQSNDSEHFSSTATNFMNTWQPLAISSGGASASVNPTLNSAVTGVWSLPYNLYPQTLFGFNLLNQTVRHCVVYGNALLISPHSGLTSLLSCMGSGSNLKLVRIVFRCVHVDYSTLSQPTIRMGCRCRAQHNRLAT